MTAQLSKERPFPGLRPFDFDDREYFFGRDRQVLALLRMLDLSRFVAVVGSSGSGKSSLVRAGLLPVVHDEAADKSGRKWRFVKMHPGDAPIAELTKALCSLAPESMAADDRAILRARIEFALNYSSGGIGNVLRDAVDFKDARLLLVVDQFEELFRYAENAGNPGDANKFVQLLLEAARDQQVTVHVLLTMRSDFIGDCAKFYGLPEVVSNAQFLVPNLTRDQREEVITAPIDVAGGDIEPSLVQRLLMDAGGEMDDLPVLQHALARLWEIACERSGTRTAHIKYEDYVAIGGLERALSQHADEIMASLHDANLDVAVEMVFRALSERDRDGRATRRALHFKDLLAETGMERAQIEQVVNRFREDDCSFLTPSQTLQPQLQDDTRVDVGHEALLRRWKNISGTDTEPGWLDREENDGRWLRGLAALAGSR